MYNLCIIIRYQKHQMVAIRPTAGISPKSGKQQTEFCVTSRHEGPNFDSPESKSRGMETDSNLRVDCLKRFETLWSQPWSMWALFVEASIWKICFCVVFPVLLLIQFPQFPLGLASNHLKQHLSSESWIMTNLVQGQNGQSQTGQLELAAELW